MPSAAWTGVHTATCSDLFDLERSLGSTTPQSHGALVDDWIDLGEVTPEDIHQLRPLVEQLNRAEAEQLLWAYVMAVNSGQIRSPRGSPL